MWELDLKEGWAVKNWCFWTVVLEKTLESLLDCQEIKPVRSKGNQSWIFTGRTVAEAPILWPSMRRANSSEKTLMLGKIEGRRRREWQGTRRLDGISDSMEMNLSKLWEMVTGHLWRTRFQFGFAGGSVVKNHAGDTVEWVWSPGQEDPLEEEMATHSSILAWRIPWTEEPVGYSPWGHKEVDTTDWPSMMFQLTENEQTYPWYDLRRSEIQLPQTTLH